MKSIDFINKRVLWLTAALLILPISQTWAGYTITFSTGSNSSTKASSTTTCASVVTSGSSTYVTGNLISPSNTYDNTASGLRIGNSSASGSVGLGLSASGQVTATTIVVNAKQYSSGKTKTLSVNGATSQTPGDSWGDLTFTINSAITTLTLSTNGYLYISSVTVNYASCSVNPSATGDASINGSFTLTSLTDAVSVSSGTWGAGSNCSWTDYGFVWGTSSSLSTSNKVEVGTSGQATSWATDASHKVQPSGSTDPTSWSVGTTYYVKAYGKNGKAGATYYYSTNAASFTLRSITYNSNGGSTVNTQYVNSGGIYSAPTAPTKTGYNFEGWYTDNGTFENSMDWSSAISENKVLYAKWTAKQCTVNFDIEGGTGTITSVTATYGQAMPSKESNLPTKTGYNFGGFWDGDDGTGTQYYNADGTSKINWNKDVTAAQTLYAKWTIKSYSVTWKVDGTNYTTGAPSSSVNHGSHISKLPTAPDPGDYCGNKFMGWTDATDGAYVHGTSGLYKTADEFPTASGAQIFYAVFADYAD